MKKITTLLFSVLLAFSLNGQEIPRSKQFMTYYTLSSGIAPFSTPSKANTWLSLEAGCWGIKKPVMYGLSMDFVRNEDSVGNVGKLTDNFWLGVKPYYQIYSAENYYLFTYMGPKYNLRNGSLLLETGIMNYTQVTSHFYTSVGFGIQFLKATDNTTQSYPGFSFGLNLVY